MKKLFYCLSAFVTLLLAASCAKENLTPDAGKAQLSYTVALPTATQTKGEGGYAAYDLHYEVYKTVDATQLADLALKPLFEGTIDMTSNPQTVNFDLLYDQDYTILFWANKDGMDYFDLADLRNVGIKQAASNNDDRDAFCGMDQIVNFDVSATRTVTLKRPFAQINIATEIPTVGYDLTPKATTVKVANVPVAYNVLTAKPVGAVQEVTFTKNLIPGGTMTVDGKGYTKVAMNYVLVPEANVSVYYEIETPSGTVTNTVPNVPLKPNHRTNIIGNLLTSAAKYIVEIKPGFDENSNSGNMLVIHEGLVQNQNGDYEISNGHGFVYALNNLWKEGGNFYLVGDIDVTGLTLIPPTTPSGVTSNLYGTVPVVTRASATVGAATITGLTVDALIGKVEAGASVSFSDIVLDSKTALVKENEGEVVIRDCENNNGSEIKDNLVLDGTAVDAGEVKDIATLKAALSSGVNPIVVAKTIAVPNGEIVELDLNGKTVSAVDETEKNFEIIKNQGILVIKNSADQTAKMTVKATINSGWNRYSAVIANTVGGNLTIEGDVEIEHLGGTDMAYGIDNLTNGKGTSAVTTIDGATVKSPYRAVRQFLNGVEATNELYVKAGSELRGDNKAIFFHDPSAKANTGKLVVEEGAELYGGVYLFVTEGSTEWPVEVSVAASAVKEGEVTYKNIPEGYELVKVSGIYRVRRTVEVASADALVEALESGNSVVFTSDIKIDPANMSNAYGTTGINVKSGQTIDGNGKTLDVKGAGGTWDSGINTTGGLIKNLKVTGSFRGVFINHNSTHSEKVVLDNVTIEGTTYTISCDQGTNQGLEATNSTFKGWTSFAKTLGSAKFTDCTFGEGNGYAYCRPYAPTEFVGCAFEAGYELEARAAVTFENCTLGGVALTAENLATLVTANIANASVK